MRAAMGLVFAGLAWASAEAAAAQAVPPSRVEVCVAHGRFQIHRLTLERGADGTVRLGGQEQRIEDLPQARGQAWFAAGEPVIHNGATYRKVGEPAPETWPLGRYNRFKPRYRGAPMMEPLGGEDRELLVLVDPLRCVFQRYVRDPAAGVTSDPTP